MVVLTLFVVPLYWIVIRNYYEAFFGNYNLSDNCHFAGIGMYCKCNRSEHGNTCRYYHNNFRVYDYRPEYNLDYYW